MVLVRPGDEPASNQSGKDKKKRPKKKKDSNPVRVQPFIADKPAEAESHQGSEFGFTPRVERLVDALTQQNGSFRLGIMGPWGSGKSSFCKMMKKELEGKALKAHKRAVIWFDASQYQQDEKPLLALIATIFEALAKTDVKGMPAAFKEALGDVISGFGALLKALKFRADVGVAPWRMSMDMDPKKALDHLKDAKQGRPENAIAAEISKYDSLSPWIKKLESALNKFKPGELQLFIFVDDLDRCPWKKALTLLEQVKVILDLPHCVFVFALNKKIILNFIKERFTDKGLQAGFTPQQYFEKMVDLAVEVPRPSGNLEAFARELMTQRRAWIPEAWHEGLAQILSSACHGNPRTLIKMLNQLLGHLVLHPPEMKDLEAAGVDAQRLLFEVCLEVLVPKLHFELKHHHLARDYVFSLRESDPHNQIRMNDFLLDFDVADKIDAVRKLILDENFANWFSYLQAKQSADARHKHEFQEALVYQDGGAYDVTRLNRPFFLQLKRLQQQKAQRQVLDLLEIYLNRLEPSYHEENAASIRELLGLLGSLHSYDQIEVFCFVFLSRLTKAFLTTGSDGRLESRRKTLPVPIGAEVPELLLTCRSLGKKVRQGLNDPKLTIRFLRLELDLDSFLWRWDSEKILPLLFAHESQFDNLAIRNDLRKSGELFFYAFTLHNAFDTWIKQARENMETLADERVFNSANRLKSFVVNRAKSEEALGQLFLSKTKALGQRLSEGPLGQFKSEIPLVEIESGFPLSLDLNDDEPD